MSDAFIAPLWVLINVLLVVTAWQWSRRLFPQDPLFEVLVHIIVLSWACIVAMATLLGVFYCLSGLSLLVAVGAVSAVALVILGRTPIDGLRSLLAVSTAEKAWLCFWCVQVGFWIGHVVSNGLWRFSMDWDTLNYHLPLVDHWLQVRSLYAPDCGQWTNPGNNELLALWATGPFSGDFVASLSNLLPTLLFTCSTVGFGLRIGLPHALANLTSFALTANFVVLNQLSNNGNDVAVAACFFATVYYGFRFAQKTSCRDLCLAGISLGLLAGIKFYASGYAVLALGTLVILAAVARGRRAAFEALLIGMIGLFLWGGYWYVRNFVVSGSPLYPKEFFKSPDTLTKIHPEVAHTSFFGNGRSELLPLYIEAIWQMAGPCQLLGFLAVPLSMIWFASAATRGWYRQQDKHFIWNRLILALLVAVTGLLLGITPFAVEDSPGTLNQMHYSYCPVRYGMCFLSIATIGLIRMLHDILSLIRIWFEAFLRPAMVLGVLLTAGAIFQIIHVDQRLENDRWDCLFFGIDSALVIVVGYMTIRTWPWLRRAVVILLVAGAATGSAWVADALSQRWHQEFQPHYDRYLEIGDLSVLVSNSGESITICVLDDRSYPFFGSRRQHRVCQPVYVPSSNWLMSYFEREKVDFVVYRLRSSEQAERQFVGIRECLDQFPQMFHLSFNNNEINIYELIR